MKKWESTDSNHSAYDLQSLLAALASFPIAEGEGIQPSRQLVADITVFKTDKFSPLRPSKAENCGPDPQPLRSHSLAGWPYPGRLALHCAPGRIRTCRISGLSGTRLPVTSQAHVCPRKDSNLQTPDPKSGAFASLTTRAENKKASDFSEAVYGSNAKKLYDSTIQPRS